MVKIKKLISEDIEAFLNRSIKIEMDSAQIYYGMSAWLAMEGFNAGAALYRKYGDEEQTHAKKIIDYLDDRNALIQIPLVDKPSTEFKNVIDVVSKSFDHEGVVENNYKILSAKCLREGDSTTFTLAQWFLHEQIEESVKFRELLDYINLIGEANENLNYYMEKQFKKRL